MDFGKKKKKSDFFFSSYGCKKSFFGDSDVQKREVYTLAL